MAGSVDEGIGVGVAVEVEVGDRVGDGAGVGVAVSGAGVSVGAGLGVDARSDSAPDWREGAAVAGGGVAWPGDCANEVEGW